MKRVAIYGKGGIGKSTVTSNVSVALAEKGYKVMQIGCDPKSDSTASIMGGESPRSVLDLLREGKGQCLEEMVAVGESGVICVECGGPSPGVGCAGRGIITSFQMLDSLHAFQVYEPDIVLYDVLGDVVCGGFAMPIRNRYARDVFIVSSAEKMSAFAARNIATAIRTFSAQNYAELKGIIQNSRDVENEDEIVDSLSRELETQTVYRIPRDRLVQKCEERNMTVVEGAPDSSLANHYRALAERIWELSSEA